MSTAAITNIDGRKWMHTEETELGDVSRSREVDGDYTIVTNLYDVFSRCPKSVYQNLCPWGW